ncbi:MAG: carboxypeptidase-like regulatory domain-containing protein [Terracidiphilus sp.]
MSIHRIRRAAGMAFVLLVAGLLPWPSPAGPNALGLGPVAAQAQNLGERVVAGDVVNASSSPMAGAVVFLENVKSKTIRSFTTTAQGRFQFAQVNMSEDYELWAEKSGRKTSVKTVSSWDARKEFNVELKLK